MEQFEKYLTGSSTVSLGGEDVRYKKPVFRSLGCIKFINQKGLKVGDNIVLCEEEGLFRGTKYRIRAQKCNGVGLWVDV
ncbi:hypothetical protein TIFTF001_034768 [Ficus carica]|uniref:Uncharacterized protein n=1 Tax=Ficus carica TaxID=3494 RepID=A0AA88E0E2_FICCA|nr:hypothetical protein TIFTF001_034768 [Ficus carica]